jgi:hypothetical protein
MRKFSVALLIAGMAMLLTPSAFAAPTRPSPPTGSAAPTTQTWLRLSLQSLHPRVVSASDTSVTVMGTITNISDRWVRQLTAGLQLDDALTDSTAVRSQLGPATVYGHSNTTFQPLTAGLAPGQSVSFSVGALLQGAHSLRITQPGVYPLRVNVQGVPDYGSTARLAVGSLLLPVLSAPDGGQPSPAHAAPLTMLWPLVDAQPRVVAVENDQAVLSDDTLATSLSSGGRLFGLLDAVEQVASTHSSLLSSLCFAVDPDLLDTVNYMAAGYRVRSGATTVAGRGTAAAAEWLSVLKGLTAGHCVLALPYADADLTALVHAGGTNLLRLALAKAAGVPKTLGAAPMANVAWPPDGVLDTRTMTALAGQHVTTVLLDPDSVTPATTGSPVTVAGFTGGNAPTVLPIDPMVSAAMAPRTDQPNVSDAGISAQDGLAAVIYRTVFDTRPDRSVLIAPPRRWSPSVDEAVQFLSAAATMVDDHYATATPLPVAAEAPVATGKPAALNYPPSASTAEVSPPVVVNAVESDGRQRDLLSAMSRDVTNPHAVLPPALIDPLQLALLRSVSGAWRNGHAAGARAALDDANAELNDLLQDVTVVQPTLPISLGSKDSTVPVTVINRLPVDIEVRVDLTAEPGLPSTRGTNSVPAGLSVTMFIKATVTRSGRFSVYATARTLGGTEFGQEARFELVSNAYGTIILIVTVIAFGLLVLLSGRRIFRRMRAARSAAAPVTGDQEAVGALVGAPDVAGEGHSEHREPDEH